MTAKTRSSGETAAEEVTKEQSENFDASISVDLPEETRRTHRSPGFARMRTDWNSDDRQIINQAKAAVEGRIRRNFMDAYQLMYEVYDLVRTPEADANGEAVKDQWGLTVWAKSESGSYREDWTKLTSKQRENFLFAITTRIFEWEQRAADAWAEAMFAKAAWEERFSIQFDAPMSGTVDDRKAYGNKNAADERYFAIFLSVYSRKADAIVRSLSLLGQRLKDSMGA